MIEDTEATVYQHDAFTVITTPSTHSLCGDIVYIGTYSDTIAVGPIVYDSDPDTREWTFQSNNQTLEGVDATFTTTGWLADYPKTATAPKAEESGTISFLNPCLDPFTFTKEGVIQTNPGLDDYSGTPIVFTLSPFTITPPRCEIQYECVEVFRKDMEMSNISCDDFTVDGILNGDVTDG